jgi:predicted amidohydrolase YtcJ
MKAVTDLIPSPTPEQRRAGILKSIDLLHREGMTAVKDPAIDRPVWDAYRALLSEGKLTERNQTGSLEVGKDADIAIWDKNPYQVPAHELRDLRCRITIMNGEVVYNADGESKQRGGTHHGEK